MTTVHIVTTEGSLVVDALRTEGVWALHESHPPGGYVITHVPTGRALIGHQTEAALHTVLDQIRGDDVAVGWMSDAAFRDCPQWSDTAVEHCVARGLIHYHRHQWMYAAGLMEEAS